MQFTSVKNAKRDQRRRTDQRNGDSHARREAKHNRRERMERQRERELTEV